jgi:hypothetical protein
MTLSTCCASSAVPKKSVRKSAAPNSIKLGLFRPSYHAEEACMEKVRKFQKKSLSPGVGLKKSADFPLRRAFLPLFVVEVLNNDCVRSVACLLVVCCDCVHPPFFEWLPVGLSHVTTSEAKRLWSV